MFHLVLPGISTLQAAANLSFRLGGWLHLWRGFIGEDPSQCQPPPAPLPWKEPNSWNMVYQPVAESEDVQREWLQFPHFLDNVQQWTQWSQEPFPLLEGRLGALLPTAGRVSGNSSGDGHHADDCAILRLVTLTAAQKSPSLQNIQLISKDDRCKRNTTFHFCGHKVNMLLLFRWTFHHQQLLEAHMEQLLPRLAIAPVPVSWFIAAVSPTQSWPWGTTNTATWASEVVFHRRREGLRTVWNRRCFSIDPFQFISYVSFGQVRNSTGIYYKPWSFLDAVLNLLSYIHLHKVLSLGHQGLTRFSQLHPATVGFLWGCPGIGHDHMMTPRHCSRWLQRYCPRLGFGIMTQLRVPKWWVHRRNIRVIHQNYRYMITGWLIEIGKYTKPICRWFDHIFHQYSRVWRSCLEAKVWFEAYNAAISEAARRETEASGVLGISSEFHMEFSLKRGYPQMDGLYILENGWTWKIPFKRMI